MTPQEKARATRQEYKEAQARKRAEKDAERELIRESLIQRGVYTMPNTDFNYKIVERVATLSQSGETSKELNLVSYNGASPKYDIRSWRRTDGEEKLLKGLTLTGEEASRAFNAQAEEATKAMEAQLRGERTQ